MDRNSPDDYREPSVEVSLQNTVELVSYIRSIAGNAVDGVSEEAPRISSSGTADRDLGRRLPLVQPVVTPRFAISCTPELLDGLGRLVKADPTLTIQTHISENESEIATTKSLFPAAILPSLPDGSPRTSPVTYADVYDAYGLLNENTILAHAIHLEDEEVRLIKERNAGISHCPTSNFNLRSGFAKVGMLLDHGIKVCAFSATSLS